MKISLGLAMLTAAAVGCTPTSPPGEATTANLAAHGSPFVLPSTIIPTSNSEPNFGIDLSTLTRQEAAIVESAWDNFSRVLAGKEPECRFIQGVADGGSSSFDCGSYHLTAVQSLFGGPPEVTFRYGPTLDFLNGHRVERIEILTHDELKTLTAAP